ncbi:MAG: urate hydroxylase PuuD [Puniceicoccaceae bacterium]
MDPTLIEFFNVVFRFVHIIAAIMWIGNSLLFTWMEINLIKDPESPQSLGHMNMLHAGGVFFLDKRIIDPANIPPQLHVFRWQSYTTWLSGAALLILTFYTRSGTLLLDPSKSAMTGSEAMLVSAISIVLAWVVYDRVWKSPLRRRPALAIFTMVAALVGYTYWIDGFYNNRFVLLQIGAMMATTMTANVYFVIIPNQKKMMAALREGKPHDLELGKQAKLRSLTNHYVTFPVIFLMLSAHFPGIYSAPLYIPIVFVLMASLVVIKHMMNIYLNFEEWLYVAVGTFVVGIGLTFMLLSLPDAIADPRDDSLLALSDDAIEGRRLVGAKGCVACHQPIDSNMAPSYYGIFNTERKFADGTSVIADEAYLRESILYPNRKIVAGYAPAMPGYAGAFSDQELNQLIAYIMETK